MILSIDVINLCFDNIETETFAHTNETYPQSLTCAIENTVVAATFIKSLNQLKIGHLLRPKRNVFACPLTDYLK
jgi:hypothetical protein